MPKRLNLMIKALLRIFKIHSIEYVLEWLIVQI